ncbi:MAG: TonB-dependent receptor, partial [Thermoanaerobaculia bacterium]|nr:TonB-dependent receptor [Thermoanaerobaculia bacterium]
MKEFAIRFGVLALIAAVGFGSPLTAQETEEPPAEQLEEGYGEEQELEEGFGEELTVTARKREENLQDVPFSIVAPTEEVLQRRGASNIEEISANVAGFTVQNLGPGQSQVAMRGVSAGQIVRDQPGVKEQVGIYLDESVISLSLFTPDIDLFDINRVEVLRGPQGTLFGSGSLSGTVRYITNQPEIGVSETTGELSVGSVDGGDLGGSVKVAVNAPLSDTTALRFTGYYNDLAGYIDAVQPELRLEKDVNDGSRAGGRLALRFEPNDDLVITPRLIYQEVDMDGWNRQDLYNILANPFTTSRPAIDLGEREQFIQFEEPFTDEFLLADLNIEWDINDAVTLTSITSYTDRDVLVVRDATALTASITGGTLPFPEPVYTLDAPLDDATTAEMVTQELRLSGNTDTLDWVAGVFYSTIERDYGQSLLVSGFEDLTGIPTAGNFGAGKDILFFSDLDYEFDQTALFGELTYSVTDKLDITAGARFYDFEEDRVQTFDGIFAAPGTNIGSTTADGVAPRVIASYQATPATHVYGQVSKGFRLGGINDPLNVPLCTPQDLVTFGGRETWEDEVLWNYEVGSKSSIMGGRGTLNAALFFMDIEDLQATVTAGSCSSRIIFNVPEASSTGVELEWVARLDENFDFAISGSFVDSERGSTLSSTDA